MRSCKIFKNSRDEETVKSSFRDILPIVTREKKNMILKFNLAGFSKTPNKPLTWNRKYAITLLNMQHLRIF